jgi:hypothetical protein
MTDNENAQPQTRQSSRVMRWVGIGLGALAALIVAAFVVALIGGASGSEGVAAAFSVVRDFFIIVLALQGILISVALVVLIVQLSALINVLQNEVSPLLDEARRTVTTMRGTTEFVSKNVTSPVIRAASVVAGARAFVGELAGIRRNITPRSDGRKR